jgi:PAS domain S-box-containing protein
MNHPESISIREATFRLILNGGTSILSAASNGVQALLGYSETDFLSGQMALNQLIHADDRDVAEILFSPTAQNQAGDCNLRLRQASGRILCVKGHYRREAAADGVVLDLRLQDAKSLPRTMAEAATNVNFEAIMENTDDYIYFKDRNHVFTGASQTLVSLCSPAKHWTDLIGQTDYDVFPEEFADIYYRLEKQVFAGLPVAHEVQETLGKDGKKGWVDNRKYPIRDSQGALIGLYGIARDITALKQAETMLRTERERLKTILETVGEPIFVKDNDHRIISANPAFFDLFALEVDAVIGKTLAENVPPDERRHFLEVDRRVLDTGISDQREEALTVGGLTRTIVTKKTRFIEHSGEKFLVGSIHDITAQKAASDSLKLSLREKEALLKEVHHRVKNNLQVITSLLRMEARRSGQADTKAVLHEMQGRIRSMALLHETLYRSGNFADVDLAGYLKQVSSQLFRSLVDRPGKIQLRVNLDSIAAPVDQSIPCGLIVNELVTNCVKHGFPEGRTGEIRIDLQRVAGGAEVCLRVADTGVGLPASFDPAQLLSLGLQLVSDLARQLGGRLEIGPGPEAVFAVTFTPSQREENQGQ